jgi:large subunit ribosomal protein L4
LISKNQKQSLSLNLYQLLGLIQKKTLIVVDGLNKNVYLSARNLKKSEVVSDSEISTFKIMNAQHLVIEEKAIEKIESNLE